jgi:hypothetical protein
MRRITRQVLLGGLALAWTGAAVYRDPRKLANSVARLIRPPVDAEAAAELAAGLPDDYKAVEDFVSDYVPYKTAWAVYGLPWYFPTVPEVLADRAGDCQAQAILMASILEAKGMPYTIRYSFDHVWVDYPGRQVTELEDPTTSFVSNEGKGWLPGLPKNVPLRSIIKQRVAYHWTPMPRRQKALLLVGVAAVVGHVVWRCGRRLFGGVERAG